MGAQNGEDAGVLARTASDADGILHLIALADDVEGWVVTVDGAPIRRDPDGFRNDPTMRYFGRPSWMVEGGDWQLVIDGERVSVPSTSIGQMRSTPTSFDDRSSWAQHAMHELAVTWFSHPARPRLDRESADLWTQLVDWWIVESEHPLPIRSRSTGRRGSVSNLAGRRVVFVDNSPAQWIFARAVVDSWRPTREELDTALSERQMPVAQILRQVERALAEWTTTLATAPSTGTLGWRLHHIDPVATGRPIERWSVDDVTDHARRFLNPSNMFVLPAELKGLGEVPAFIEAMRRTSEAL